MNAKKIGLTALAMLAVVVLLALLGSLFQRLLIAGARLAQGIGDTVILDDETPVGGDDEEPTAAPMATWPPGDDPSWSEAMPLAPVDKTAEEMADKMKGEN